MRLDASLKTYIEKIAQEIKRKYENILRAITRLEYQNNMPLGNFTAKSMSNFPNALRDRLKAKGQTHFRRSPKNCKMFAPS
ncbi:MAG: hypothetical protein COA93_11015 [Alphaproteobacteria bacterium]|nr:MAG: hypothetical protein COA93_11015 [Alphaproteobacteria bacterium]